MNSVKKGKQKEKIALNILKSRGYFVEQKPHLHWINYSKDFFNHFDLFAISKNDLKLIQVKSSFTSKELKRIRDFPSPHYISKELWVIKIIKQNGKSVANIKVFS